MNGFFSSVAGATLRWLDLPGEGLPLVFIHGLGCASSYDYPRVASAPALNGRRKILFDLPGFGYSDKPHDFSYNIHSQAQAVEQVLDHLRLQRFALYGHSMGGSIAIEAAGLLAERVTTLLVSEPNLVAGGGEYSRRIAAQSEAPLSPKVTPGCWRKSARPGPAVCKTAPPGPSGEPPAA